MLYFILLPLMFVSCNQGTNLGEDQKEKILSYSNNIVSGYNIKIIGQWSIPFTKDSLGTEVHCNVCPRIIFQNNGIAEVIKPFKKIEKYNWSINSDTIIFLISDNILQPNNAMFNNDKFIMIFKDRDNYNELELKQIQKNYSYILRK